VLEKNLGDWRNRTSDSILVRRGGGGKGAKAVGCRKQGRVYRWVAREDETHGVSKGGGATAGTKEGGEGFNE